MRSIVTLLEIVVLASTLSWVMPSGGERLQRLANELKSPAEIELQIEGAMPADQRELLLARMQHEIKPEDDAGIAAQRICGESSWCSSATTRVIPLPNRVLVIAKAATPEFVIEKSSERWLVSANGSLIQPVATINDTALTLLAADLPMIKFNLASLPAGAVAAATTCARFLRQAVGEGLGFEQFSVDEPQSITAISNQPDMPPFKLDCQRPQLIPMQVVRGMKVAQDLKRRGEQTDLLDLRNENQVIVK